VVRGVTEGALTETVKTLRGAGFMNGLKKSPSAGDTIDNPIHCFFQDVKMSDAPKVRTLQPDICFETTFFDLIRKLSLLSLPLQSTSNYYYWHASVDRSKPNATEPKVVS